MPQVHEVKSYYYHSSRGKASLALCSISVSTSGENLVEILRSAASTTTREVPSITVSFKPRIAEV
jgi:hypothetical protein